MKYSIVVVAYQAQEYLEACLKSIAHSNSKDYEIIIVDNSPTDIAFGMHPPGIPGAYIHTGESEDGLGIGNIGFAAACNLGAKRAKGEILCFLNPDTQVYGDWLERMSRFLMEEGGPCHAVGPVSNKAAGIQNHLLLLPQYGSREEWRPIPTKVLIGFCLMMSRKTWDDMEGMDPGCFLGCDDLDLSWRMSLKGYRMGVASDVYVHHECHKSFEANPKSDELIKQSEEYLKRKLMAHYPTGKVPTATELWGADFMDTGSKPTISACMITSDEDMELVDTPINAIRLACYECSLVSTGIEEFHEVSTEFVKYNRFPWCNDFAAARNHSLSHCTGDWVIWLDADDRIPQDTIDQMQTESFRRLLHKHHTMIRFKVRNVGKNGEVFEEFMQTRMFRRTESHWEGRIHEHLVMDGHKIEDCPTLVIDHTGYSDEATVAAKSKRNLALLAGEPDSPETWLHRGHCYGMVGDWLTASACFGSAFDGAPQDMRDYLDYQIGLCMENLGSYSTAAIHYAKSCRVDGLCRLAEMAYRQGLPYARPLFFQFLQEAAKDEPGRFVSHTSSLITHAQKRLKELENGTT